MADRAIELFVCEDCGYADFTNNYDAIHHRECGGEMVLTQFVPTPALRELEEALRSARDELEKGHPYLALGNINWGLAALSA